MILVHGTEAKSVLFTIQMAVNPISNKFLHYCSIAKQIVLKTSQQDVYSHDMN